MMYETCCSMAMKHCPVAYGTIRSECHEVIWIVWGCEAEISNDFVFPRRRGGFAGH